MKITRIAAYGLELPFREGAYRCRNRTETGQNSTLVEISTDTGLSGWGEVAPLGAFYSEAFAGGVRAGVAILAPELLGHDPREIGTMTRIMDGAMYGQMDAKTPIDIALWDLFGQACGLPLAECLGGRDGEDVALYRSISQAAPDDMTVAAQRHLDEGYRRLQVKVGEDPLVDAERLERVAALAGPDVVLYCDANGAWSSHDALRFLDATRAIDYVLEQPCMRYEENLIVRRACTKPMVLDESCDSLDALVRIRNDGAADGVTIKISRFGGITRSRLARDLAVESGLKVTIECIGGAQIISAAIAHMCLSTPQAWRTHTVDFHNWMGVANADGFPEVRDGRMAAPREAGLGVRPLKESFGEPLYVVGDDV